MPITLPMVAATNDQMSVRSAIAHTDSGDERQCHAYHAITATSATQRKRAPMAQPQASEAAHDVVRDRIVWS
jgi:hypothetical protein